MSCSAAGNFGGTDPTRGSCESSVSLPPVAIAAEEAAVAAAATAAGTTAQGGDKLRSLRQLATDDSEAEAAGGGGSGGGNGNGSSSGSLQTPGAPAGWLRWGGAMLQQGWASCTAPAAAVAITD